jgi:1-acyl-sn-glycerol-3-phosphate acyltransferase
MKAQASSAVAGVVRLLTGASVCWKGCRPELRQRIYFANHTSHVDSLLVWCALPPAIRILTRPVGARDYWGNSHPARGLLTRFFGAVLIDRDCSCPVERERQVETLLNAMGESYSLILFPEGTRGAGPGIAPFRSGLYHLSLRRPGLELVPVHLDNVWRLLPKGEVLPVPMACRVTFGPSITLGPAEPKARFLERAREAVWQLSQTEKSAW